MRWLLGGECLEGYGSQLELNTMLDGEPMQLRQQAAGRAAWVASKNDTSQGVLDSLKLTDIGFGDAKE